MDLTYRLIRSDRKTLAMELTGEGGILIRAPRGAGTDQIEAFIRSHRDWIDRHRQLLKKREVRDGEVRKLTEAEKRELAEAARSVFARRTAFYAPLVGVDYGRITLRYQRTRWGSCSARGNLNFNCLLLLAPLEVLDSVVVHELCHRKEMNHSPAFYREVCRVYPDYKKWNQWLKEHGRELMKKI